MFLNLLFMSWYNTHTIELRFNSALSFSVARVYKRSNRLFWPKKLEKEASLRNGNGEAKRHELVFREDYLCPRQTLGMKFLISNGLYCPRWNFYYRNWLKLSIQQARLMSCKRHLVSSEPEVRHHLLMLDVWTNEPYKKREKLATFMVDSLDVQHNVIKSMSFLSKNRTSTSCYSLLNIYWRVVNELMQTSCASLQNLLEPSRINHTPTRNSNVCSS